MSFLSNWRPNRKPSDESLSRIPLTIRPARSEEISPALRLILGSQSQPAQDSQVVDFLRYSLARGIDVSQLWVAVSPDNQIISASLPVPSAGRTMLLLTPSHLPTTDHLHAASQLIDAILSTSATQGTQLVQILFDPDQSAAIELYLSHAFYRLADLTYLQASPRRSLKPPELPANYSFTPYSQDFHSQFAITIAETYRGSLDCPALAGRRDIEDVVAGHKATGDFDPSLWFLLKHQDTPLGVLLLSPAPPADAMELVYLGLTPAARGQGLADLLMQQALYCTQQSKLSHLTLAADSSNTFAMKLYHRHGLKQISSKVALMCDLTSHQLLQNLRKSADLSTLSTLPPQAR